MSAQNNELLEQVLIAHGGLERWNRFNTVHATIVTGGSLWAMKGLTQDSAPRQMTVWLHEQRASVTPFGGPDQLTAFSPDRIAIERTGGKVIAERSAPRESFRDHGENSPWDPLHRAYFNGYALWSYLTMPFQFTWPGVATAEVEPWQEGTQHWRRLRVTFPEHIATHCAVQDFYFGEDFLLRRHDYKVDISGGLPAAQYVGDYVEADGLRMPGKRRAYRRGADGQPDTGALLVAIDLSDIGYS
ncbi:hypothetical protein PS862_01463 [Pseudomonas fluorescens]|uniref:Uncharacterized protein n=1 Tax=Pseudomonas fluorescens TaxID=294 RepID=A0A5E7ICK7_PSEFL|nr:hypothetical protein [Pseudomonas fluorescens]VVN28967.1 hypothetical protein PS639_04691 [Pseudomonas fluorescens]VVO73636.1 hypothetical protein PS862_01463 [Pseudomonas fluorescens]